MQNKEKIMTKIRLFLFSLLISLFCFTPASAETVNQREAAVKMAQNIGTHFAKKDLAQHDARPAYLKEFKVVIAHSLGNSENEHKSFKTLAEFEAFLKSRETDQLPARNSESHVRCQKGICHFEIRGMLHNNLYLKSLSYVYLNGQPYFKTLSIVDGD